MIEIDGKLGLWTIYEKPDDYPDKFVGRLFVLDQPTTVALVGPTLDSVREFIRRASPGLTCIPRFEHDHPSVIETWL
jgi:hypothetical protein